MSFLLSNWTYVAGVAAAIFLVVWRTLAGAKKAGVDQQKVREAEARARDLERIKAAAAAKPVGSVSDDPHNRDNRKS